MRESVACSAAGTSGAFWYADTIAKTAERWKQVGKRRRRDKIYSVFGKREKQQSDLLSYATFCKDIGLLFERNGEHNSASQMQL
jgi:hypothetical protein